MVEEGKATTKPDGPVRSIAITDEFEKVELSVPTELVQITFTALIAYVPSGNTKEVGGEAVLVIHVLPPFSEYLEVATFDVSAVMVTTFTLLPDVVEEGNETEVSTVGAHNAVSVLVVLKFLMILFNVSA